MPSDMLPFEQPLSELRAKIDELRKFGTEKEIDFIDEVERLEKRYAKLEQELYANLTAEHKVQIARHPQRPTTLDYIQMMFTDFIELHGDRLYGDDMAVVGGLARFNGIPITVVGHQKGKDTKDNIARNFGTPHPEGFRKALRLMEQANKFGRPIISFMDTKGAYPGGAAEERGQAEAIARNLRQMAGFRVPIICVVIGEGGSGGALALGLGNRVLMLEHAIYSVSSPEAAASIMYKDASKSLQAAALMKITAKDILEQGAIDEIVPETRGGAHRDPQQQAKLLKDALWRHLQDIVKLNEEDRIEQRYEKFRNIGKVGFIARNDAATVESSEKALEDVASKT